MSERVVPLDDLSGWTLPPLWARDTRPVRVFDTAEAAMLFREMPHDIATGAQRARSGAA